MNKSVMALALLSSMLAGQSDTLGWLEYFPMHIGDQWQYHEIVYEGGELIRDRYVGAKIVKDSVAANGKRYFYFDPPLPMTYTDMIRFDTLTQRIYFYHAENSICYRDSEYLFFDFTLIDSNYTACPECYYLCESCEHRIMVFTALNDTLPTISCRPPEGWTDLAAPIGLALIGINGFFGDAIWYSIVAAKINGELFGEFVEPEVTPYFPMHIGDQWQYRADTDTNWTTTYSILDTVSFKGSTYFAYGSDSLPIQYLRPDTLGNIYRYFPEDAMETIWFNFQVAEGDTYHLATDTSAGAWNWVVHIYGRTDTLDTPAGIFTDCIRMLFDVPQVIDEEQWYVFAPDVGLVEYYGASQPTTTLYQAVVDGVHYPKSTEAVAQHRETPTDYALFNAYPNPFNPVTTVAYNLPETAPVTLTIYDILGRKVIELVDNRLQPAGYYRVTWDGRDGKGLPVPTGIYIARLVTPTYTSSVKMLLLK